MGHQASPWWGCPIRTSADHSLLAAPRGLSQPSTSFIGSRCQGIHRAPFLARRLDLSNSPSRQDQCSLSLPLPCSTTLQFSRCSVCVERSRSGFSDPFAVATLAQKRPDIRRAPNWARAKADTDLCDWRLRTADDPISSFNCGARAIWRSVPRDFSL